MNVDAFTFIAQVVNFLILVYLLKRFLYQPIAQAMTRRESKIQERIDQAAQREKAAQTAASGYQEALTQWEKEREKRLAEVHDETESLRNREIEALRKEMQAMRAHWQETLTQERAEMARALRDQLTEQLVTAMRAGLRHLADVELEEQLVRTFLRQLEQLAESERRLLKDAMDRRETLTVRTALPLSKTLRSELEQALTAAFGGLGPVKYVEDTTLIGGISAEIAGRKLVWNLADYVAEVEQRLDHALSGAHSPAVSQ